MKKINEYEVFIGILNYLKSSEGSLNRQELCLIEEFYDTMQIDRNNSIINYLFHNDENINKLLEDINREIDNNKLLIKSSNGIKVKKYIYRKDSLIELRDSILDYINNQEIDNTDKIQEIIEKCIPSLKLTHYKLPVFFDKKMIDEKKGKYIINKDVVNKVYSILEDSNLMNELRNGIKYIEEENNKKSIINSCMEANSMKSKIYRNSNLIFEYNMVSKDFNRIKGELRSSKYRDLDKKLSDITIQLNTLSSNRLKRYFNKEKEEELRNKLERINKIREDRDSYKNRYEEDMIELERLSNELKKLRLFDYVDRKDASNKDKSGNHSLHHMLSYMSSRKDLDNYYNTIEIDYNKAKRDLGLIRKAKLEYLNSVSSYARELLTFNSEDVLNIMDFSEKAICSDITPAIALYIIKGLNVLEDSIFADKNISNGEISSVYLYYDAVIKANYETFKNEFEEVKHSKPKTYKK